MTIYCANIQFKATDDQLRQLFEQYGTVESCRIVTDRDTGKSRGFAFVEMEDVREATKAIDGLDGYEFMGRKLVCNQAKPKEKNFNKG